MDVKQTFESRLSSIGNRQLAIGNQQSAAAVTADPPPPPPSCLELDNAANTRKRSRGDAGRCTKVSSKRNYTKKRRNIGKKKVVDTTTTTKPISLKKVKRIKRVSARVFKKNIQGYRLIDTSILQDVFMCLNCPDCQQAGTLFLEEKHDRQKGLASNLVLICECGYENEFYTSQTVNKCSLKQGMNPFEVNLRAVYGMRTIGADHASLEKLCGFFNMPKPMTVKNFTNISNSLHHAAKVVAQRSMSRYRCFG